MKELDFKSLVNYQSNTGTEPDGGSIEEDPFKGRLSPDDPRAVSWREQAISQFKKEGEKIKNGVKKRPKYGNVGNSI